MADIIIGSQIWAGKNYDINYAGSKVYDDNEANRAIYGGLYTYQQIINPDFCPAGYHVPTVTEWNTLITYIGDALTAGGILKEAGTTHWDPPNSGAVDTYGFAQRPTGYYFGGFGEGGQDANLWTATEYDSTQAQFIQMDYNHAQAGAAPINKNYYLGLRLIKDINLYIGYGASYNAFAALGNIAPTNCHVPSKTEWDDLITYLGGSSVAGGKLKEIGFIHWLDPNTGADNSSGFTGLPAGIRTQAGGFQDLTTLGYFWSTTEEYPGYAAYALYLAKGLASTNISWWLEKIGMSIRCIRDSTTLSEGERGLLTDYDGNIYPTICINGQEWMGSNLTVTHYNDGTLIPNILDPSVWAALTTGAYCLYGILPPVPPVEVPVIKLIIGTDLVDFNEPFNVMYSIGDVRSMEFGNNNKTYTLNLPLTKKNKKAIAFINQADVKSEISAKAWLYLKEMLIISGSVVVTDTSDYFAKILITSDDWINSLSAKKLSALDLSAYDHALTNAIVAASWVTETPQTSFPFYRYPMINFGALMSGEINVTANWWTTDFIPMFSVPQLIAKILEPYTISSTLLATTKVKNLFILAKEKIAADSFINNKDLLVSVTATSDNEASGSSSTVIVITLNKIIDFLTKTTDQADEWSSSYYTIPETGTYRFKTSITLINTAYGNGSLTITNEEVIIDILQGAISLANVTTAAYSGTELIHAITYTLDTGYCHCTVGDLIKVDLWARCAATINSGTQTVTVSTGIATNLINIWNNANKYSGLNKNISAEELLPDMTQLDFLAAIRDIFNLRFWMDKSRQIVYIEPWDQFLTGEVIDLTKYIDFESIETELISKNYSKNITFKWKDDDSDEAYKQYLKTSGSLGQKDLVLNSIYTKAGIDKREHPFSSIIEGVNHTIWEYAVFMPRIWTEVIETAPILFDRKTDFNTRIVEWKGLTAGFTWYYEGVSKATYPKVQGLDWSTIYSDYWIKFMHYIDQGKLFTVRMKLKTGMLTEFFTVVNDSTKEGFRPTYCIEIDGVKNYFFIQKITSDGEKAELEIVLKQ